MTDKFISFFRLLDACVAPRCPVCVCLGEDTRRALQALLEEHVVDPATRRDLHDAWGLCSRHASGLVDARGGATAAGILLEDLLRRCRERFGGFSPVPARARTPWTWLRATLTGRPRERPDVVGAYLRRRPCPVCARLGESEQRYVDAIVDFAGDPQLDGAYAPSPGLCVPHLVAVAARGGGTPAVAAFVGTTLSKWDDVRARLTAFVAKHEYRATAPIEAAEADACRQAAETLAGLPDAFAGDRPPRMSPPPPAC